MDSHSTKHKGVMNLLAARGPTTQIRQSKSLLCGKLRLSDIVHLPGTLGLLVMVPLRILLLLHDVKVITLSGRCILVFLGIFPSYSVQ